MTDRQPTLFSEPQPWDLDDLQDQLVAGVVFSTGPSAVYDYLVPDALRDQLQPGYRVRVPFGRGNHPKEGFCVRTGPPSAGALPRLKSVLALLDPLPLLSRRMLDLTLWLSNRYLCSWGQSIEAAVPSGVREQSGLRQVLVLRAAPGLANRLDSLTEKQRIVAEVLLRGNKAWTLMELQDAAGTGAGPIQALRKRELILAAKEQRESGVPESPAAREPAKALNHDQANALQAILAPVERQQAARLVLHGVTGSGKTEVYIQAIERVLAMGRQAIVLVPEMSLTPQTRQRFRARFPRVAVQHSHQTAAERSRQWREIHAGGVPVVVGARSAVFAPTPRLGIIVLDEEHDGSFKQDSAPRYHARDVAWHRCQQLQIPLVLGSATPSLEMYHAMKTGTATEISLPQRVNEQPLPHVKVVDLRAEAKDREGAISRPLLRAMRDVLKDEGQIILLLNRRGFATRIQCPACGHVENCPDCDISLTYHEEQLLAICHYCDFTRPAPVRCSQCDFPGIRRAGLGTQRLEREVRARFPQVPCVRMDSDSMRKPGSHEKTLNAFRDGQYRILLGTQMIAKGLDFPNVLLVGVINSDTQLHMPNFRAAERTFQLVTQVAGRTGRGSRGGSVIVQAYSPDHPAIVAASRHDYATFAAAEILERQAFGYPPATSLIRLVVRGESVPEVEATIQAFAVRLRTACTAPPPEAAARVLGPAPAPMPRLRGKTRHHLLMFAATPEPLAEIAQQVGEEVKTSANVQWIFDVDPQDIL